MKKELLKIISPKEKHWVGNGFHVSTLFSIGSEDYRHISPFLMLDHARASYFPPTNEKLGVGEHPHRGFETVTFAIKGEIEHRDSGGGGGVIKTGGVQWMTAASGVVHDEFHSKDFAQSGGDFEMVQLWVNLPAKNKMDRPGYQSMNREDFPIANLAKNKVKAKVVAGEIEGTKGPAKTYTPMNIYELDFIEDAKLDLAFEEGSNLLILQLEGHSKFGGTRLPAASIAMFGREGISCSLEGTQGSKMLVLNGRPIDEPVANYGPFVMNTRQEILQAIEDFQNGKMGQLVKES